MIKGRRIFRRLKEGYKALTKVEKTREVPIETRIIPIRTVEKPLEEKKEPEFEGIEIPTFKLIGISRKGLEEEEVGKFTTAYPLIPVKPSKDERIFAYTKIYWDPKINSYRYHLVEPDLTPRLKNLLIKVKNLLEEKLDIDLSRLKKFEARGYLHTQTFQLLDYFGIKLTETEKQVLTYYIDRDFLGMGVIEPLMQDPDIEDVSCDGTSIPLFIFHRNPLLGSIPTNIIFNDGEDLDSYLIRLAQLCGQAISVTDPLLGGSLPDGSRIQGTLATDIARRGSNFTIRKFTKKPLTPPHLLKFGTIDIKTLAFLWLAVDKGCSILISGGTATGKTALLNILSLFIKPDMKVVSIEDTAELKLPHPHWVPHVARVPMATQAEKRRGEIDLFDLLKESLRQRPDYIIVGEVRGPEAYVLFQQMATGHASYATIHAESHEKLINRLISPPISLPPSLLECLDLIVFLTMLRYRGKHVRKVNNIYEVIGFDPKEKSIKTNKIFEWDTTTDKINIKNKSAILAKIKKKTGMKEREIVEELKRRMAILFWLEQQNIYDYRDVGHVINLYYEFPQHVLDIISGEI
jgi:flagellar protein FlaI